MFLVFWLTVLLGRARCPCGSRSVVCPGAPGSGRFRAKRFSSAQGSGARLRLGRRAGRGGAAPGSPCRCLTDSVHLSWSASSAGSRLSRAPASARFSSGMPPAPASCFSAAMRVDGAGDAVDQADDAGGQLQLRLLGGRGEGLEQGQQRHLVAAGQLGEVRDHRDRRPEHLDDVADRSQVGVDDRERRRDRVDDLAQVERHVVVGDLAEPGARPRSRPSRGCRCCRRGRRRRRSRRPGSRSRGSGPSSVCPSGSLKAGVAPSSPSNRSNRS